MTDFYEIKQELLEFAELEGTEWAEYLFALCELDDHVLFLEQNPYLHSELRKEILKHLKDFKDNYVIKRITGTRTFSELSLEEK